ncbi:PucR family transcriptional regulator [Oceanirhabdus seepicola]|uniref:Helix-turn-helix domain-containing protein n=1 Tax=Oceanirhabdus seepicola TaxID=2828781 RepID=A0A9J6NZK8_9CLOT|nr:helix-turn-helix domain-containing protein [Oceanirhabdus seepicola]MCM1989524.1 helix-turn-helix domain-containing protein [Oceanirhabdus seepicola]
MSKILKKQGIEKLKNIIQGDLIMLDGDFNTIWSKNEETIGEYDYKRYKNIIYRGTNFIDNRIIYMHMDEELVIVIEDDNEFNRDVIEMVALFIEEEKEYDSKEDVIKGLINGEIDKKYAEELFKKLDFKLKKKMKVYIVECRKNIEEIHNLLKEFFDNSIILLNDKKIVVIDTSLEDNLEEGIQDVILSETMIKIKISVGTIVNDIFDIKNSYDRAMKAMVLGKRLIKGKNIFYYDQMILPIIINGVKSKKLTTLSNELFQGMDKIFEERELMQTATSFLENNLNISETSKKLFIHRNTLTYRLNKIKKLTRYDLRNFEDAVNFKIALYIHSYVKN